MPTGDLTNNLRKLQKEVKLIKYSDDINLTDMSLGNPTAFLPVYHYAFTSYSHALAQLISASDTELYGKTDFRFIEAVYKILRDLFNYKPLITKEQFFNVGFAERKIIMCSEVLHMIREKNRVLNPPKKSSTGGSAVSGLSHLKPSKVHKAPRPKSAEPVTTDTKRSSSTARQTRPKTGTESKNVMLTSPPQITSAPPQVVNELLQPHKPQGHPVRHMTVIDHLSHPLPSQDMPSPPRVTKERLTSHISSHPPQRLHFLPVTPGVSKARVVPVEVISRDNQESEEDDEDEDEEDQIETVNAVTRGESFLEPQQEHASPVSQSYVPNHETYGQTLETVLDRMNSLGSVVRNLSNLVEAQAGTHVDDRVTATLTAIQQQLDTLMARMVLVENRVALVEARLGETRPSIQPVTQGGTSTQSWGIVDPHHTRHTDPHIQRLDEGHQELAAGDYLGIRTAFSTVTPQEVLPVAPHAGHATHGTNEATSEQPIFPPPNLLLSNLSESSAFGLSPIRKPTDLSINNSVTLPPFDITNDDTFAGVTQSEKRLSSTPTKHPVMLETLEDSLSFHFGDHTSQERMLRIKNMIKETEHLLTKPTSTLTSS